MNRVYPWSAVVGQERVKLALTLCAIDPAIGGVLIHGSRGMAKTTLARALGELMPGPFVELPLGASEERVTGTLDLDAALRGDGVSFAPGLLARAHQGVLYVDEVNLLADHLVDLLLDAAASGRNVVERDGISHAHAARFVLIGSMNPDEGELRPQLLDRFGLCAPAGAKLEPAERIEIVSRRLAFERDPEAFTALHASAHEEWRRRAVAARARIERMAFDPRIAERVAMRCSEASVEGVRADLAMLRAARAHAAWCQRTEIRDADLDAVAELALAHRRAAASPFDAAPPPNGPKRRSDTPRDELRDFGRPGDRMDASGRSPDHASPLPKPQEPSRSSPSAAESSGSRAAQGAPGPSGAALPDASATSRERASHAASEGDRATDGAIAPVPMAPPLPHELALPTPTPHSAAAWRRTDHERPRGEAEPGRSSGESRGAIDWFATLLRATAPKRADLRFRARSPLFRHLLVLAVDCSASMLRGGALAEAKRAVRAIGRSARQRGTCKALVSFQGSGARLESAPKMARGALGRALARLGAGGGTPLRGALETALTLASNTQLCMRRTSKRLVLFTDGRSRDPIDDLASELRRQRVETWVIDCERGFVRLGLCTRLVEVLGATALTLDALAASAPRSTPDSSPERVPQRAVRTFAAQ